MCDYSLDGMASRPAEVGDRIIVTRFATSFTRGFGLVAARDIAVCLSPGIEIVFDRGAAVDARYVGLPNRVIGESVARFRRINDGRPALPHDALEFSNGEIALVALFAEGQTATVIRMPASGVNAAPDGPLQLAA
jgi:hypothetical protein